MWNTERIKRFWEACGVKPEIKNWQRMTAHCGQAKLDEGGYTIPTTIKDYAEEEYPDITDLNALEKWALPTVDGYMIFTGGGGVHAIASREGVNYEAVSETLALALAEAIEKALIGDKNE